MPYVPSYVENEGAYIAAINRNIRENAYKTRRANWFAMPQAQRAHDFLFETGEFAPVLNARGNDVVKHYYTTHPVVRAAAGDFFGKMYKQASEWGGLSEKQNEAVLNLIARGEARVKEWETARQATADRSGWVGVVGERGNLSFTVKRVMEIDGQYGISFLHICEDEAGNVIIYKGTKKLCEAGETVTVKATVKEHTIRDGVRQTKITRPATV